MTKKRLIVLFMGIISIFGAVHIASAEINWFTPETSFPDGTLIRPKGFSNVFVIQKAKKFPVTSIDIFNSYGYEWENVKEVDQSVEQSYHLARLVKMKDDPKVYYWTYGGKFWIRTPQAFLSAGYKSVDADVIEINKFESDRAGDLKFAQRGKLCPTCCQDSCYSKTDDTVYALTSFGTKRAIRSAEIYESYGYDWNRIATVPYQLVDVLPDTELVRAKGDYKVYKLENGIKRWIVDGEAFKKNAFSFNNVEEISFLDLDNYPQGVDVR